MSRDWDAWFIGLAQYVATASKDPSTQAGAVIIDAERRIVSTGYNGFPRGVRDDAERYADRETKYRMIVHCERNAILFARRDLRGCTLYTTPLMSCSQCAGLVIQSGITRCVAPKMSDALLQRWGADCDAALTMFREAGVDVVLL